MFVGGKFVGGKVVSLSGSSAMNRSGVVDRVSLDVDAVPPAGGTIPS
jgi:hypothetical protein